MDDGLDLDLLDAAPRRALCAVCERPASVCWCAAVPPAPIPLHRTRVLILQHPLEVRPHMLIVLHPHAPRSPPLCSTLPVPMLVLVLLMVYPLDPYAHPSPSLCSSSSIPMLIDVHPLSSSLSLCLSRRHRLPIRTAGCCGRCRCCSAALRRTRSPSSCAAGSATRASATSPQSQRRSTTQTRSCSTLHRTVRR